MSSTNRPGKPWVTMSPVWFTDHLRENILVQRSKTQFHVMLLYPFILPKDVITWNEVWKEFFWYLREVLKTHVPKLSKRWALICFPSISFCFILCLLATWNRLVPLAIGLFRCVRFFNQHKQRANVNLHDHELPQISYLTNNVLLLFYNQVPPCLPRTSLPQLWRVKDLEDHHCQPDCHQV